MVLPASLSAALTLLLISILCFALWPLTYRFSSSRWRFELFSLDFAIGSILFAVLAAYTLGTRGSDLGFSDSMLVAGQRAQATAVLAGFAFALANMCFLASITLIGLSNAGLLTFSVFGCGVELLHLQSGHVAASLAGFAVLAVTAVLASVASAAVPALATASKLSAVRTNPIRSNRPVKKVRAPVTAHAKGIIVGVLAGLAFAGALPLLGMSQSEELGIGAYGGVLMASIGILIATFLLDFFFLNISLQGGKIGYATYLTGTLKDHLKGIGGGVFWTSGALALYAAYTGTVKITRLESWLAPFGGALIAILAGVALTPAKRNTFIALGLFVIGVTALLSGFRI